VETHRLPFTMAEVREIRTTIKCCDYQTSPGGKASDNLML
jgi:hypothetical protein